LVTIAWLSGPGDEDEEVGPGDEDEEVAPGDEDEEVAPGDEDEEVAPGDEDEEVAPGDEDEEVAPADGGVGFPEPDDGCATRPEARSSTATIVASTPMATRSPAARSQTLAIQ
jgi:hypothetical protein